MKLTASEVSNRYSNAYSIKSSWDTEYRDIFEYTMPARDGYQKAVAGESIDPNYQDRRENLFSSIGEQAANDFVNTMQEVLAPPMSKWIALEAGMRFEEEQRGKVNDELAKMTDHANEYKNNSAFDMAFSEFCYDLFAGTACLLVLPGTPRNPLLFKAIPTREYCIEEGVNAEVRGVFRKYELKRELLSAQWPELKGMEVAEDQKEDKVTIIESTWFDYDLNVYHYQVVDEKEKNELIHREYKTNPFIVLRWNKCAGEAYGRGPGMTAINDIKTLNLFKYYSMRVLAFAIPPLLAREDDMIDVDSFELAPLAINVVPDPHDSVVPMNFNTNVNLEQYKSAELEMQIKKDTYSSTLPNEGNRDLTATEVRQRIMEMRKSLNSVFGRLLAEFQIPLVRRIIDVLTDTNVMGEEFREKFDLDDIDGLKYKVNIVTPIGKLLKHEQAQAMLAAAATLMQFDPTGRLYDKWVKEEKMIPTFLKDTGLPADMVNTAEEAEKKAQGQAQSDQAQAQQAAQMDVEAANQKEMGKVVAQGMEV